MAESESWTEEYREGHVAGFIKGTQQGFQIGLAQSGYFQGFADACQILAAKINSLTELAKYQELLKAVNKTIEECKAGGNANS